jgi:hypothetical protein
VYVGPRGFSDGDGEEVLPVDDAEIGGGADALSESAQHGHRGIAQQGLDLPGEGEYGESEPAAAIGAPAYQAMLFEGDDEPVDDGATHPEGRRDFRHGERTRSPRSRVCEVSFGMRR